jgi:hypothetical protein
MPNVYSIKTCINCGISKRSNGKKFCGPKCQHDFNYKEKIKLWLDGKHDGMRGKTSTAHWIKRYITEVRGHQCECCKIKEWMDRSISLDLEHKDGNFKNNKIDNLGLICPNCHSQTDTYKGRNKKGRPRSKYYRGL